MDKTDELFSFNGNKMHVNYLPIENLLDHFEQEVSAEWVTEDRNKIRKARTRQRLIKEEIIKRLKGD